MWEEYLKRTSFVAMHGALLVVYFITLVYSIICLVRERHVVKHTYKKVDENNNEKSVLAQEVKHLAKNRSVSVISDSQPPDSPDTGIQSIISQTARAISNGDEILRFCINGFVVIGLMGTLSAFYEMWQKNEVLRNSSAPTNLLNSTYLEDMATALVVSFIGLILALITNLIFSILKTFRNSFLGSLPNFLHGLDIFAPVDYPWRASPKEKDDSEIKKLIDPVKLLVLELATNNSEIVEKLSTTVTRQMKESDKGFKNLMDGWKELIQEFKQETISAVSDLKEASNRLAVSSYDVSLSMADVSLSMTEVSVALERTKDIGKIVAEMENISINIIDRVSVKLNEATDNWESNLSKSVDSISGKLDKATGDWASGLSKSVQEHITASDQQAAMLDKAIKDLSASAANEFRAAVTDISGGLETLKAKFISDADAIASKWMTEMLNSVNTAAGNMQIIVEGWRAALTDTSSSVGTALGSSREILNEMTEKTKLLGKQIEELSILMLELTETAGAPIHLSKAVEEITNATGDFAKAAEDLGKTRQALEDLSGKMTQQEAFSDVKNAIEVNSLLLSDILELLKSLGKPPDENAEIVKAIEGVRTGFSEALTGLKEDVVQLTVERDGRTTKAIGEVNNRLSALQKHMVNRQLSVRIRKGFAKVFGE